MTRGHDVVLTGRFEEKDVKRYFHLPFAVPAGVRQLHVRYSYNDQIDSDPLIGEGLSVAMRDVRQVGETLLAGDDWSPAALAGYVEERKSFVGRKPVTTVFSTAAGRLAFALHATAIVTVTSSRRNARNGI